MKIELTPSGVEAIDGTLGGLIANDITLLCGPPRAGKTIAGLNHIIWLLRQHAPVMLVTTDLPEAVIELADSFFEFDVRPEIEAKRLTILTLAPNFTNRLRSLGTVARAFDELALLCEERHVKHVVFDTVDPVLAGITVMNVKRFVQEALTAVRKMGVTLLCTSRAEGSDALKMGVQELAGRVATTLQLSGDARNLVVASASWSGMAGTTLDVQLVAGRGLVASDQSATSSQMVTNPPLAAAPTPHSADGRWSNQVNTLHVDSGAMSYGNERSSPRVDPVLQAGQGAPLPAPRRGGMTAAAAPAAGGGQRGGLDAMPTAGVHMQGLDESRTLIGSAEMPLFDESEAARKSAAGRIQQSMTGPAPARGKKR